MDNMKITLALLVSFVFIFCSEIAHSKPSFDYIKFGAGGGFTGNSSGFIIKGNGDVYKWKKSLQSPVNEEFIKRLSKKKLRSIVKKIKKEKVFNMNYHEVGNYTYFMEYSVKGIVKTLSWTEEKETPAAIKEFNNYLHTLIN